MANVYASYPVYGGGGVPIYSTFSAFPAGTKAGQLAVAADTGILYEWNGSSWQAIGGPGAVLTIGTIDSEATPSANGATISSNALILQSASGTVPGLVNTTTQSFAGGKTFLAPIFLPDGTASAPSAQFTNETNTGWYRTGTGNMSLSILGVDAFSLLQVGSNYNIGIGTSASSSAASALNAITTYNGTSYFAYANLSVGASSTTALAIGNGTGGGNYLTIENQAYATTSYTGGGGLVSAGPNLSFLNICAENSGGYMTFNVGGRTLATEAMRLGLSGTGLTINKGWNLSLSGSTSGAVSINASTGTYNFNLPTTAGTSGQLLASGGGSGAPMTWVNGSTASGASLQYGPNLSQSGLSGGSYTQFTFSSGANYQFDTDSYSATANAFTVPTSGLYTISGTGVQAHGTPGVDYCAFFYSIDGGSTINNLTNVGITPSGSNAICAGSVLVQLTASQAVTFYGLASTGSAYFTFSIVRN